jgi:hypothetical protein
MGSEAKHLNDFRRTMASSKGILPVLHGSGK